MGYIDTATSYLTDKEIRFLKKFVFVIITIVGLILIDSIFSFSFYGNASSKIQEVKEINKVLESKSLSDKEVFKLKALRANIINHKYLFERDFTAPFKIMFNDQRNGLIHYISSSWYLLFLMISLPFLGPYHPKFNFETVFIVLVVFEPILLFLTWFNAKVFEQIPLIGDWAWWNYILNALLGVILGVIVINVRKRLKLSMMNITKSQKQSDKNRDK